MARFESSGTPRRALLAPFALLFVGAAPAALPAALQGRQDVTPIQERPRRAHRLVQQRPDGSGPFIPEPHQGGGAAELRLSSLAWGRLVDVHGLLSNGTVDPAPYFRDFAIGEGVQTDGADYVLQRNPATQVERLIVLREPGAPAPSAGARTFIELVRVATSELTPILPKPDDGTGAAPFTIAARNAVLVARFNDLLDDSEAAFAALPDNVRLFTGYRPDTMFAGRILFDRNYGGISAGEFHTTRVLFDLTVSEFEAADMLGPVPLNVLGLPASLASSTEPNVSLRIPSRVDLGGGQFTLLRSLGGAPLSATGNDPIDLVSPTRDVVRAFRSGNERVIGNGFLQDEQAPELLGNFPATVTGADNTPSGDSQEFVLNLRFESACAVRPVMGDVIQVNGRYLEVLAGGAPPDGGGNVSGVIVRASRPVPVDADDLLGPGSYVAPYRTRRSIDPACFVRFIPQPSQAPAAGVDPASQALVRFSEPLDPGTVRPLDTLRFLRDGAGDPPRGVDVVVGAVSASADLAQFTLTPSLPLAHVAGMATPYRVDLGELRDLAGNALAVAPDDVEFTLDPGAASRVNGGVALRFASGDELEPEGLLDLSGQFLFDFQDEFLRPRDLVRRSFPTDRNQPVGSIMIPWPFGSQQPLSPLGSKVQAVWRYADFGWQVEDDTLHNLDVEGLSWVPQSGQVVADFFEEFEIRLAHANRLPDESINFSLLPRYPQSGLRSAPETFAANVLDDPRSPQAVVHPRALGYVVSPVDLFLSSTGTTMMPYPWNRGAQAPVTYTWRDTAVEATGGEGGAGIPMDIEVGPPLFLEQETGTVAQAGEVPSIGLPLLMEFRTYPTDTGIGLNRFDLSLAINSSSRPFFRAYSAGGVDTTGSVVLKDPDLELSPSGGFNPASTPPGLPSRPVDNLVYLGQVDVVNRINRVYTVWIDTQLDAPDYQAPLVDSSSPANSTVELVYRGAVGFSADAGSDPFDGLRLDAYGNPRAGDVFFFNGDSGWSEDIDDLDGARYLQVRIDFASDLETRDFATLNGLGIAYGE